MTCISQCIPELPEAIQMLCDEDFRLGGLQYLIASKCNFKFDPDVNPITDWESWKTAVENRDVLISPALFTGEKPETEKTQEKIKVCGEERTTSQTHLFNGVSKLFDVNNKVFDFWDEIERNQRYYRFGWLDCNERVYADANYPGYKGSLVVDHIIPATNDETQSFNFTLRIKKRGILKPTNIPNIEEAFENMPVS